MVDREEVIKGLECCIDESGCGDECPYWGEGYCRTRMEEDALALLKGQEPVHGEWKWSHGGQCSECGYHNSNFEYKYCPMCGAVMDRR